MKEQNPAITNSLVDGIVKLAAARRARKRWQSVRLRRRMMLQVGRCFAEIAAPIFGRQRRGKHPASDTPEFGCKQYVSEHGDERGEQL